MTSEVAEDESFYRNRIHKLLSRWEDVIGNDGNDTVRLILMNGLKMDYFLFIPKSDGTIRQT